MNAFVRQLIRIPLWVRYGSTILICIGMYLYWKQFHYQPMLLHEKSLTSERAQLLKQRDLFYKVQSEVAALRSQCHTLSTDISTKVSQKDQLNAAEMIKRLIIDADECGLSMAHCAPQKPVVERWYKKEPVKLISNGEYFDFADLLDRIKHYNIFAEVPQMKIEKKDDALTLECVVQTYSLE